MKQKAPGVASVVEGKQEARARGGGRLGGWAGRGERGEGSLASPGRCPPRRSSSEGHV